MSHHHTYYLVIQARTPLDTQQLAKLSTLSAARQVEIVTPELARLYGVNPVYRAQVDAQCTQWGWDAAFIPAKLRFSDIRLLVSDMDSTLITIECIDEIADIFGIKAPVAAITERSMRGELDFTVSLIERVALLAGLDIATLEQVYQERLQLTAGAETLVAACQQHGVKFMLVSGGFTYFTERLQQRLGLDYQFANQLEVHGGKLTGRLLGKIIDADAKRDLLINIRQRLGLEAHQVLAVGDGANDLKMLAEAGLSVAFHAKPIVRTHADVALNVSGLDGIVRLFR